ncbi:homoaconitate hydratase family protein [Orrella sp. NBD-18]|uniref:3-isopropylmalate dehydratase large subunit n=2 Tax=Sheuella amnicola TaxID=2707330 RepID=A0A6B2R2K9_9BURK|nr:homoaconitate hydratase family protein [Sheuella amnicola]
MGLTMTEKIFSSHAKSGPVRAGEIAVLVPDVVLLNDTSGSITVNQLDLMGVKHLHDPEKVVLVADHFSPPKDVTSAESIGLLRGFGKKFGIEKFYDSGRSGIEHALLPELGKVGPGGLIFGADSHTCTAGALNACGVGFGSTDLAAVIATGELWAKVPASIRVELIGKPSPYVTGKDIILSLIAKIGVDGALNSALEFGGPGLTHLNVDERFAVANMAVEAGADTCVFECDAQTLKYVERSGWQRNQPIVADNDATYLARHEIHLDKLEPLVAVPPSPANGSSLSKIIGTRIDQVYIGNCSNGTITDIRQAAHILKGRTVAQDVRLVVVPATSAIYRQASREGLLEMISQAGGSISMPTCGACFGGHMGILAKGESAISTTNRNYRGRMGHPESKVYLANAWVAAAAAIAGKIIDPATLEPTPNEPAPHEHAPHKQASQNKELL